MRGSQFKPYYSSIH